MVLLELLIQKGVEERIHSRIQVSENMHDVQSDEQSVLRHAVSGFWIMDVLDEKLY